MGFTKEKYPRNYAQAIVHDGRVIYADRDPAPLAFVCGLSALGTNQYMGKSGADA